MMVELELKRLVEIQHVMGAELPEIVGGMLETMSAEIERVEVAIAADQLELAAKAAHACRNDALIIGARQLLVALTELENAARGGQAGRSRQALEALLDAWPATRSELARVASGGA